MNDGGEMRAGPAACWPVEKLNEKPEANKSDD